MQLPLWVHWKGPEIYSLLRCYAGAQHAHAMWRQEAFHKVIRLELKTALLLHSIALQHTGAGASGSAAP